MRAIIKKHCTHIYMFISLIYREIIFKCVQKPIFTKNTTFVNPSKYKRFNILRISLAVSSCYNLPLVFFYRFLPTYKHKTQPNGWDLYFISHSTSKILAPAGVFEIAIILFKSVVADICSILAILRMPTPSVINNTMYSFTLEK